MERDALLRDALARVETEPGLVVPEWTLYTLVPVAVEFRQADKDRVHERLRHESPSADAPWERRRLRP